MCADDELRLEVHRAQAGSATCTIFMENPSAEIWALAFDILLPEGMEFDQKSFPIELNTASNRFPRKKDKNGNLLYTHSVVYDHEHQEGRWWRVIIDTNQGERIKGQTGAILTMHLKVSEKMATGSFPVQFRNVLMIVDGNHAIRPDASASFVDVRDGTVAIRALADSNNSQQNPSGELYDLSGRRSDGRRTGVYIQGGRLWYFKH